MPHLTLQTTPNVKIEDEASLLKSLNQSLWDSGHFGKPTDIKARVIPIEKFLVGVADGECANGFIYARLKIMSGRDLAIRNQLAELLVATIEREIGTAQSDPTLFQICVEVEEISEVYNKKMLG